MKLKSAFLFLWIFSRVLPVAAAIVDNRGKEFWLAFPAQYQASAPALTLLITAETSTTVQVTAPGVSFSSAVTVAAGSSVTVILPETAMLGAMDGVENLGVHVLADQDISVFGIEYQAYATDGYLGLPVTALGSQYLVASYQTDLAVGSTEFALVAAQDGTSVTITLPVSVGAHPALSPYAVSLNLGQTYQIQDPVLNDDLTGAQISSNQPVALFGANSCVDIPSGVITCNMVLEQMFPLTAWGVNFVTFPLATRKNGDTFRFLASVDGTQVGVNGTMLPTLNRGQFLDRVLTVPSVVTASAPLLVIQYSNSRLFDDPANLNGDPSMTLIPSTDHFRDDYLVAVPYSGFATNELNVVAPNGAVGSVNLDGSAIPAGSFTPIGASGFSGVQLAVAPGPHHLSGSSPFGIQAYGFDARDAYGYAGGLKFSTIATPLPTATPTLSPTPTPSPTPVCEVHVWPDPFSPLYALQGKLKLDCLQPGDQVSFFTVTGELVKGEEAGGNMVLWDGRNQQGVPVVPGVYYYAVQRGGGLVTRGKILLVRP